jgi:hypothetical protein
MDLSADEVVRPIVVGILRSAPRSTSTPPAMPCGARSVHCPDRQNEVRFKTRAGKALKRRWPAAAESRPRLRAKARASSSRRIRLLVCGIGLATKRHGASCWSKVQ